MNKEKWLETLKKTRMFMLKDGWKIKKEKSKNAKKTR